ncbi:MAG TPA: altronate dehydratase family protein [Candidatus Sulfotelmatobacter sp.]|nr:altronate dehydratase family protein [Candidatus Sulfotelmatobacter sp.]
MTLPTETKLQARTLQLDPRDNVLIALTKLHRGETVQFGSTAISLLSDIAPKHKFAATELAVGDRIIMYGIVVGQAAKPIQRGELLTTTNVHNQTAPFHAQAAPFRWTAPDTSAWAGRTFQGFRRSDGQVGTRNYWLVVPLVFCENRNIMKLKQALEEELGFVPPPAYRQQVAELAKAYRAGKTSGLGAGALLVQATSLRNKLFENVDGIRFLLHEGGCGGTRQDANSLCGLIANYIHHPNVAGATVLSLGCQNAQASILQQELQKRNPHFNKPVYVLEQQRSGSEQAMLSEAIRLTFQGLIQANEASRSAAPISDLCLGLKCGGSDGFSGISANPALGRASDLLVALGGRTILSEFPELCGVEQELIDRGTAKELGDRFIQLMTDYAARARAVGSGFDMNPSPGNIRDGLLTDAMKSAGAAKKGGTAPVSAVLDYPEYATRPGLNLQCTPGNDVECVTAQVGAGANVVLFTTGLGTPTGNPIAPVVKVSSNTDLSRRMADIIDVDTGSVIAGSATIQEVGDEILDFTIRVASGEIRTKAEVNGQEDFIPWKRGVSL